MSLVQRRCLAWGEAGTGTTSLDGFKEPSGSAQEAPPNQRSTSEVMGLPDTPHKLSGGVTALCKWRWKMPANRDQWVFRRRLEAVRVSDW